MAQNEESQSVTDLPNLKQEELPDCLSCKIIGAGACFGSSAYLLTRRNTLGLTRAARSIIGIVAAGLSCFMCFIIEYKLHLMLLKMV